MFEPTSAFTLKLGLGKIFSLAPRIGTLTKYFKMHRNYYEFIVNDKLPY